MNFQESMTIVNACAKKSGNLLNGPHILLRIILLAKCLPIKSCIYYVFT